MYGRSRHNRVDGDERRLTVVGMSQSEGFVVDISQDGAGIAFMADVDVTMTVGQEIAIILAVDELPAGLCLYGQIRHRREMLADRRYGMMFSDLDKLTPKESRIFHKIVNRRQAFRVLPISGDPLMVELGVDPRFGASVLNISATGIGVIVSSGAESALVDQTRVALTLRLGQLGAQFRVRGLICNRAFAATGIRYGIQFDHEDSSFIKNRDVLQSYIMECQRSRLLKR